MSLVLRPYQSELIARCRAAFDGGARAVCAQLPTGGGKTAMAAEILRHEVAAGRHAIFLAHLDFLVGDTHARLRQAGVWAGFVQAGRASEPLAPVQVCSLQTLHVRGERPRADFVVLDECHRALGASVRAILAAYPAAQLLGCTATVQRGDGGSLGDVFEALVEGPSVRWLTERGYLVPCDVIAPAGFTERGLAADPVDAYKVHTPGQRAIVFATSVAHAEDIAARFRAAGISVACITAESSREERRAVRERVTAGELRVLVGVSVFIEGFDLPAVEAVILARAFTVTGSFLQAIGRGLRPSPVTGKRRLTVVDLKGAVHLHGLPDEDRRWSLNGSAVRRSEALASLRRCSECLAIFRPAAHCPRCGAGVTVATATLPRVLSRAERLERVSALGAYERDRRYLARLESVAIERLRMSRVAARRWAVTKFRERFMREPQFREVP
jgi:DNA repair protein RadD